MTRSLLNKLHFVVRLWPAVSGTGKGVRFRLNGVDGEKLAKLRSNAAQTNHESLPLLSSCGITNKTYLNERV
jgi:hypothetical protein